MPRGPDLTALPPVFAVVHAAPSLGDVRLCFRDQASGTDLMPRAWPTQGSVPHASYPGLAAGRGMLFREVPELSSSPSIVVDVYDAYAAGANDRPMPVDCARLRERKVRVETTLGPLKPQSGPALLALTECAPSGCPGGTAAELSLVSLAREVNKDSRMVQAVVLTRALGVAPVDLSWAGQPFSGGLAYGTVSSAQEALIPEVGFEQIAVELTSAGAKWSLVDLQSWSDPASVPSAFFAPKGLYVLAIVGSPSGTGMAALHPVVVPIDVSTGG